VFLALAGVSGWFVYRRAPTTEGAFIGGTVGGLILLIAVSWFSAIPARILEWWRIVAAQLGGDPRDGQRVAIIGTLRGHGELTAPFSRERCVLYSYEIIARETHDNESTYRVAYEGFATVPLSIEHGAERTRILARPDIKLPKTRPDSLTAKENAKLLVEHTTFAPAPKSSAIEKDLSHTDGHLRVDYRRDPVVTNIGACTLMERLLRAEANVCAIGEFRADRRALVAPVTLRTGKSFGIGAAWRVVNAAIACVIFSMFALIALTVFCMNFPIDAVEQARPQHTVEWWEIDLERFIQKHVKTPLVRSGFMNSSGFYVTPLCVGCAKGRLEIGGRTIELKHAAYTGGRSVHFSAKPGDRDGVTLDGKDRVVLTIDGKSAAVPASWLLPNDIVTALGSEGEYEGRVTVIAPDGWIRCRVAFNTRVDENAWLVRN
jgi:hypothetical protein